MMGAALFPGTVLVAFCGEGRLAGLIAGFMAVGIFIITLLALGWLVTVWFYALFTLCF